MGKRISRTYSMRSLEQFHRKSTAQFNRLQQYIHQPFIISFSLRLRLRLRLRLLQQARRDALKVLFERSTFMVELLVVHILRPIKENASLDPGDYPTLGEVRHDLLLQAGQLEMLGQAHQLVEFLEASESVGVLEHGELVLVEVLQQLVERARVVRVEGEGLLMYSPGLGLRFCDLLGELGRFGEHRFVAMEFESGVAEMDFENSGVEVPVRVVRCWCVKKDRAALKLSNRARQLRIAWVKVPVEGSMAVDLHEAVIPKAATCIDRWAGTALEIWNTAHRFPSGAMLWRIGFDTLCTCIGGH